MLCAAIARTAIAAAWLAALSAAASLSAHAETEAVRARIAVDLTHPGPMIDPNVHGQFSEMFGRGIYEGIWVGEDSSIPNIRGYRKDVVDALRRLHVPVLRWPGGCFADTYHWRDGVGPREKRPVRIRVDGLTESNAFGTHEFFDFAELIEAQPYLTLNLGTGSPQEAADWIEYIVENRSTSLAEERRRNGRAKPWQLHFIAFGNESWGCGGNMRAQAYADRLRQFWPFMPGNRSRYFIAVGPVNDEIEWTNTMMQNRSWTYPRSDFVDEFFSGLALHYYTYPHGEWSPRKLDGQGGRSTGFNERTWALTLRATLRMDGLIAQHAAVMDRYDPEKKVALVVDEWGGSYTQEPGQSTQYQQNTLRDALIAALNLDIFYRHSDRVRMANLSMMINQLQSIILTDKEKMLLTPTYHVFDLYQPFKGASPYPIEINTPPYTYEEVSLPSIDASAARGRDGKLYLALVNVDPSRAAEISTNLTGSAHGRYLSSAAMDAHNTFDSPDLVKPLPYTGAYLEQGKLALRLPAKSIAVLAID